MGTIGQQIIKVDKGELIKKLNKALTDEWLAYYQYWIGSKVAIGILRGAVVAELVEHAADELRHADMLVERILQLGGEPILEPKQWYKKTNCGYEAPTNNKTTEIVKQNIKAEQCAIKTYKKLMDYTKGKDEITYQIAFEIMTDEVEHEDDLEAIIEDIDVVV